MDMEKMICSAARLYRTVNKPRVCSDINMKHDIYADEEAESPAFSIEMKGKPEVKLIDLILVASAMAIFFSAVCKILRFLRKC